MFTRTYLYSACVKSEDGTIDRVIKGVITTKSFFPKRKSELISSIRMVVNSKSGVAEELKFTMIGRI